MEIEEKIRKLIEISKKTVTLLKKKMNTVHLIKEHESLKKAVYENQSNIFLLSQIVNNLEELKENYSNEEIKRFFENIKVNIKSSQELL